MWTEGAAGTPRQLGRFISPAGVRCVWLRRGLEKFAERLQRVEEHVAKTGEVLTEAQLPAMEKAKEEMVAQGEIETEDAIPGIPAHVLVGGIEGCWPGLPADVYRYLLGGWIGQAVYDNQPVNGANLPNDRALSFLEEKDLGLLQIITVREPVEGWVIHIHFQDERIATHTKSREKGAFVIDEEHYKGLWPMWLRGGRRGRLRSTSWSFKEVGADGDIAS